MGEDAIHGRELRYVLPKKPKANKYMALD